MNVLMMVINKDHSREKKYGMYKEGNFLGIFSFTKKLMKGFQVSEGF